MCIDIENKNIAYRLGRLFAVLEEAQSAALNVKATIRDRYYGAASATPSLVFPSLIRNHMHHVSDLRKGKSAEWVKEPEKKAVALERSVREILKEIPPEFPKNFSIEDQGRFAIGFYHQSQARFASKDKTTETITENAQGDLL